jgi:hypothetical protein
MAERKPSYTQLTHDVVQGSSEPLTLDEIIEQVNALRPITAILNLELRLTKTTNYEIA